ncbi:MAG TPA: putative glycolipid-binding domain-containing protein, partial [Gemmatimonadales bacterium]
LRGVARFGAGETAAALTYEVHADAAWMTRRGSVNGRAAARAVELEVEREPAGAWRVNGTVAPALAGLIDLDLGFTPATNVFPLRRLGLRPGEAADAEAAWLDDERWMLARLAQRYERRDATHYWYESPSAGYRGLLAVREDGFVREYPGLWVAA